VPQEPIIQCAFQKLLICWAPLSRT
jgi:hypothetical protein